MANISTPFIFGKQEIHNGLQEDHQDEVKLFMIPFLEHDVLDLQAMFVKPGIHVIKVKNILDGRIIIKTILDSLNYYRNIGFISQENKNIELLGYNIMSHINLKTKSDHDFLIDVEKFFSDHSCFDFIWVEFSQDIEKKCSLQDLKKIFTMFHAQERMPVLIIQYEKQL